ncbi:GTP-binding protein GEM [Portunus trituberculatus]|uniref:GTP-binding protein GEM n=1 Tax=Portunus trituberculatus TaxID=210409 RepID=A0A5B7E4Q6_PORTR|nr:GTP-binding protein GEM [Portunus trituberculatus]
MPSGLADITTNHASAVHTATTTTISYHHYYHKHHHSLPFRPEGGMKCPQPRTHSRLPSVSPEPRMDTSNHTPVDEEYGEQSVSVMLDGEESEIMFVDHPADEMTVENYLTTYEPHAFVVVLSVTERASYLRAEEVLQYLWRLDVMSNKGVILVANKTDIVRARCVSSKEGSNLADSYDCKYIETSSGFNHQVDELLVGILKQIRLKTRPPETKRKRSTRRKKYRGSKTSASLKVKSFLTKPSLVPSGLRTFRLLKLPQWRHQETPTTFLDEGTLPGNFRNSARLSPRLKGISEPSGFTCIKLEARVELLICLDLATNNMLGVVGPLKSPPQPTIPPRAPHCGQIP